MKTIKTRLDKLEQTEQPQAVPLYWVDSPEGAGYVILSDGRRVDPAQVSTERLAWVKVFKGGISPEDWD